jgi:hypothetical protein
VGAFLCSFFFSIFGVVELLMQRNGQKCDKKIEGGK